jgi:hypothetical protein
VIVYALENLMPKFRSDGITKEQIQEMIDTVRTDIGALSATTDATTEIKDYVTGRIAEDGPIDRSVSANYGS